MSVSDNVPPAGTLSLFDGLEYAVKLSQRERWGVPPMSVLDSVAQAWQARKAEWLAAYPALLEGGNANNVFGAFIEERATANSQWLVEQMAATGGQNTTFDPFLAELIYDWWSAPGSLVYDPFAGGTVRGVVADVLGREYLGVDVRAEQCDANYAAWPDGAAAWVLADSSSWAPPADSMDFVFSCPPYGSLERYSDQTDDLSTLSWADFRVAYASSIEGAVRALRRDRFAVFVVGNFKEDVKGQRHRVMRDLVGLTVSAFETAGAAFYSDLVHVTPVGTRAVTSAFHFPRTRRPMPRHQMVLVFLKGDSRRAVEYVTAEEATA